jgi:hypothetical protein
MKLKRILCFIIGLSLIISLSIYPASASIDINNVDYNLNIFVNGAKVDFPDQKPFIETNIGRTYVPARFISEALNADVSWKEDTQQVIIVKHSENTKEKFYTSINLIVGKKTGYFEIVNNGSKKSFELDAPVVLINDRVMVPLRFVSEAFDVQINWTELSQDNRTRIDIISK